MSRDRGLDITMVGFLSVSDYVTNWRDVRDRVGSEHVTVVPTPFGGRIKSGFAILYFVLLSLIYERVVVHGRKVSISTRLELAQKFVGDRIKFTIELEGDNVFEAEYAAENDAKSFFYNDISVERAKEKQFRNISRPDHVFTVTEELRDNLIQRYPNSETNSKTTAIMSDFPKKVGYDPQLRKKYRAQLGVSERCVYTYIGSARPIWQNFPRTIEIFSLLRQDSNRDPFLMLLVPKSDHDIVRKHISMRGIPDDAFHLAEVAPESVRPYLLASDIGVMLRDDHPMCEAVYGGKYLDYLSAGLPVVTTPVAKWSDELVVKDFGIVLDELSDDRGILQAFEQFEMNESKRETIADWAGEKFTADRRINEFIRVLRSLAA
jgi:glycosyltransferase involved in cell wall biosynthesis